MKGFPVRMRRTMAATVMAGSLAASGLALAEPKTKRDLSVEQAPIADCGEGPDYPASDIQVSVVLDHEDGAYAIGDTVSLQARATRDAYLTVLEVGSSGKVHIIFPNRYQQDARVSANQTVRIPSDESRFRIRVGGPAGREVVKVFATREPLNYFAQQRLVQDGPYYATRADAKSVARDLSMELHERHGSGFGAATQILEIGAHDGRPGASVEADATFGTDSADASVSLGPTGVPAIRAGSGGAGGSATGGGTGGAGGKGGDAILCQGCVVIPK
jgi:hypothetical protein